MEVRSCNGQGAQGQNLTNQLTERDSMEVRSCNGQGAQGQNLTNQLFNY